MTFVPSKAKIAGKMNAPSAPIILHPSKLSDGELVYVNGQGWGKCDMDPKFRSLRDAGFQTVRIESTGLLWFGNMGQISLVGQA